MGIYVEYKKAKRDFEILETIEAGIELFGFEVKSIKNGNGSLEGARVVVRGGEALLVGATIPPYQPNNTSEEYDPERVRRLLIHDKEMKQLVELESQKGLTSIPISLYNKGRVIKLAVGIARGKKKQDKRESIKKRDTNIDIEREFKHRVR